VNSEAATKASAPKATSPAPPQAPSIDAVQTAHADFSALLKQHVSAKGDVDYAGLKRDESRLNAYLGQLDANPPMGDWSSDEKLAYWINLYNAGTLKLIVDNYPVSSITSLDNGKPWDVKRVKSGGKMYSLDAIENEVIRPRFDEPRIHFAVNCAAASCPPLRNEAFVASKLDAQLEEQTRNFLKSDQFISVDGSNVEVSRIFDWYGEDFGNVAAYIAKYRDDVTAESSVTFSDYDWALNSK